MGKWLSFKHMYDTWPAERRACFDAPACDGVGVGIDDRMHEALGAINNVVCLTCGRTWFCSAHWSGRPAVSSVYSGEAKRR